MVVSLCNDSGLYSAVRMVLDGRWDMSFADLRLQETRNAAAATLLTLSQCSPYSATTITSFVSNTCLTSLHSTSKTHISVFLAVIFAKFIVFIYKTTLSIILRPKAFGRILEILMWAKRTTFTRSAITPPKVNRFG